MLVLLLFGLLIPMGWGAPQGSALVVRNAVSIVPDVAGEVTDVPVVANVPLKAGDVLFKIDPTPYAAQVKAIEAQLKLAETRLGQMTQLFERDAGRGFDVEQRQSEVDQLSGQLEGAQWNLDKTVVRAPADGYVTNLALRKGARVANLPLSPVMAFIDTSNTIIGVEINQIDARYVAPGQEVEVTFKFAPGQIFSGRVESVLQAIATGPDADLGTAVLPKSDRGRALRRARQARRRRCRPQPAGRQRRDGGDLHRPRQADACRPPRDPAADRDPELRQSVLRREDREEAALLTASLPLSSHRPRRRSRRSRSTSTISPAPSPISISATSSRTAGGIGKLFHHREPTAIDKQGVIRSNRDTLYSSAVFDLDAGPVTITLPDAGKRFMSMQVINEDHYVVGDVEYRAGSYTLDQEQGRHALCR